MHGPDDPDQEEAEDPELARRRAEVLEQFLREKPWQKSLQERHQVYLALRKQDMPAEDFGEYTASLVTGLPHIGRQGYSGSDKPPFDLAALDGSLLVDAKVFDSGRSKAQNRLKVKRERPNKQFRMWSDEGEKAIPCQFARGRKAWFLVPGIPVKDVPLGKSVTADLSASDPVKPIRLLDKSDLSDWNDFQALEANWRRALAHLQTHKGAVMARVKEELRKFGEKEARETLVRDWERNIWIGQALEIPEAKQQIVEQAFQDEEAKQQLGEKFARDDEFMRAQLGEELFLQWKARQQAAPAAADAGTTPQQPQTTPPRKGRNGKKKPPAG